VGPVTVDKIIVTPLNRIPVLGGDVLKVMKQSDIGFIGFGESYFSYAEKGITKAWKCHLNMTLNLVVPIGEIHFVFIDNFGNRREERIGESCYVRLTVPPNIWFGFQGISDRTALLLNIADIEHTPNEVERKKLSEFDYNWELNK